MRSTAVVILGTSLALASNGCYSSFDLSPQSVQSLNGFQEGEHRLIPDAEGRAIVFDRTTELRFAGQAGESAAKFSSIQVNGPAFQGTTRPLNEPFAIDLRQVGAISARKFSIGKTALAVTIPFVAVAVLVTILAIAIVASTPCISYCP